MARRLEGRENGWIGDGIVFSMRVFVYLSHSTLQSLSCLLFTLLSMK